MEGKIAEPSPHLGPPNRNRNRRASPGSAAVPPGCGLTGRQERAHSATDAAAAPPAGRRGSGRSVFLVRRAETPLEAWAAPATKNSLWRYIDVAGQFITPSLPAWECHPCEHFESPSLGKRLSDVVTNFGWLFGVPAPRRTEDAARGARSAGADAQGPSRALHEQQFMLTSHQWPMPTRCLSQIAQLLYRNPHDSMTWSARATEAPLPTSRDGVLRRRHTKGADVLQRHGRVVILDAAVRRLGLRRAIPPRRVGVDDIEFGVVLRRSCTALPATSEASIGRHGGRAAGHPFEGRPITASAPLIAWMSCDTRPAVGTNWPRWDLLMRLRVAREDIDYGDDMD